MAGTDRSKAPHLSPNNQPAIILVRPQMGENIGSAARAMLNCGLTDLRLVAPRDGWPNPRAEALASGATVVLEDVQVFETAAEAVADLHMVYAASARSRDMVKPVQAPGDALPEIAAAIQAQDTRCGILFGPEDKGLNNDEVALATKLIQVPLNPAFSSLNLAQAVMVMAYEWRKTQVEMDDIEALPMPKSRPANQDELENFFQHLEAFLNDRGFLTRVPEKSDRMIRKIRNIFTRAHLTEQEVRILHGIFRKEG